MRLQDRARKQRLLDLFFANMAVDYNQHTKSELVKMLEERDTHAHKWSAPVIGNKPIYNDFGIAQRGVSLPVAYISCECCGEIKKL